MLKIMIAGNNCIIGDVENGIMRDPRFIGFVDGGKRVQMSAMLGFPESIAIPTGACLYDVNIKDKPVIELYERVTTTEQPNMN